MTDHGAREIFEDIAERYRRRTPASAQLNARAKKYLPGGDTRTATYYKPYPAHMVNGRGCYLVDADGNEYIDLLNNYTSLIHGHARAEVMDAVRKEAPPRGYSRFIAEAVTYYIADRHRLALRERLIAGYQARAKRDRSLAEEWRPLEEEVWDEYVEPMEEDE